MKQFNTARFVAYTSEDIADMKESIRSAKNFEEAVKAADKAFGYIACIDTFNEAAYEDDSDFANDFDSVTAYWQAGIYDDLLDAAKRTEQDAETISRISEERDNVCG